VCRTRLLLNQDRLPDGNGQTLAAARPSTVAFGASVASLARVIRSRLRGIMPGIVHISARSMTGNHCPRLRTTQITAKKVSAIQNPSPPTSTGMADWKLLWPLLAPRTRKGLASASTWSRLVRDHTGGDPGSRVHPPAEGRDSRIQAQ